MRGILRLAAIATAATLGACSVNIFGSDDDLDAEASRSFTVALDATDDSRLTLEGFNGLVTIVGDAVSTDVDVSAVLRVRSTSRADAEDFLTRVTVDVEDGPDEIRIWTDQPHPTSGREVTVDYDLTIPHYLAVDVTMVNGEVGVSSMNEAITVATVNGSIEITEVVGDVEASLVNGDIDADVTLVPGGQAVLDLVNGNITLSVPEAVSAMLDANVVNGTVSVLGLTVTDATTTTRSVQGRLGGGDGSIELDVTNGTIAVRAR